MASCARCGGNRSCGWRLLPHRALLDPLLARHHDDAMHENAWRVNAIGIERSRLDELLHLGDADLAGGRRHRIEVARGLSINEIAHSIASPRSDEREIADDAALH